jgi:uronate dehydrogenase
VSPRDLTQLVRRCIDAPDYRYLVLYGVSNNARSRWRNPQAAQIGYAPQDNAEDYAPQLTMSAQNVADPATAFHGGEFCALEFTGDIAAID